MCVLEKYLQHSQTDQNMVMFASNFGVPPIFQCLGAKTRIEDPLAGVPPPELELLTAKFRALLGGWGQSLGSYF
jgi:hypothetical protein